MGDEVELTRDLNTVLGTIFLFLKNQNFFKSSEAFKHDCEAFGIRLPNISGKVFFRTDEKVGTIDNRTQHSSKKFVDKRIILETFLERDHEGIQTNNKASAENQRENPSKHQQQSLRIKFGELQEEYRNLLAVTSELTNALQLNIVSQAKNVNLVLDQCKTIYPSLFQTPGNLEGHEEIEVTVEEERNTETVQKQCLESVPKNNIDTISSNDKREFSRIVPCIQMPNYDFSIDDNSQVFPDRSQAQVSSPISQSEVRDILETVFNEAIYFLNENKKNDSEDCCGDENTACSMCTNEISKMLDKILVKVMASPRCKSSESDCCHSKDNSVFRDNKTPNTGRSDVSLVKFRTEKEQTNPKLNTQKEEGESQAAEIKNNVGNTTTNKSDTVSGVGRQLFCKSRKCPNRPRSAGSFGKEKTVANNIRCHTWSHLDCSKKSQLLSPTKGGEITPKSTKIELAETKYDEPLQSSRIVHCREEMRNSTSVENDPSETVTEKKRVKPVQQFVKFQTPLCYLESCRRLQDGNRNCRCTYCVPGKNRYYCGCYDVIRREITEDADGFDEETTCRKINFFKNLYNHDDIARPKILEHYMCERPCNAFESRPKIRRTPPE